jgi:hypothetical protein
MTWRTRKKAGIHRFQVFHHTHRWGPKTRQDKTQAKKQSKKQDKNNTKDKGVRQDKTRERTDVEKDKQYQTKQQETAGG